MFTGKLLVTWGILASCLAFLADGSTIPATGGIAAKLKREGFATTPDFETPTEEEWIEIIDETLHGQSLPNYLAERNYTYHVIETGEFQDTDGIRAFWNATSYIHYHVTGHKSERSLIRIESMKLGDVHLVSSSEISTSFTDLTEEAFISATALVSWTFEVRNDTYERIGDVLGFGQGEAIAVNKDVVEYVDFVVALVNSSNVYAIDQEENMGAIFFNSSTVEGLTFINSFPLRNPPGGELPKDFESLVEVATAGKESSGLISITNGSFNGRFTLGVEGEYYLDSETLTVFQDGHTVNATTTLIGMYIEKQSIETALRIPSWFGTTRPHFL